MKLSFSILFAVLFISCTQKEKPLPLHIQDPMRDIIHTVEAKEYNNIQEVYEDFKHAHYKDSLELYIRLGSYYQYKNDNDSALYYYLHAKRINPQSSSNNFNLSSIYTNFGQYDLALESVNKAIKHHQKWNYLSNKCNILSLTNKCEESIEVGLLSYNMNHDNKKIYGNLLRCFDELNYTDSVKKYIQIAIDKFGMESVNESPLVVKLMKKYNIEN